MQPDLVGLQHGACLCGAVVFDLRPSRQYGPDRVVGTCRCDLCRRWSGAAELPFVVVVPEHFTLRHGEELLAHYRDGEGRLRTFCRHCGSSLYYDTGRSYHVTAGVLDDLASVAFVGTFDLVDGHQPRPERPNPAGSDAIPAPWWPISRR